MWLADDYEGESAHRSHILFSVSIRNVQHLACVRVMFEYEKKKS